MVPSQRTRGNKHKLKYRKINLNVRKIFFFFFFPVRVIGHWNRLPRNLVKHPYLETAKMLLGKVLSSLLGLTLL